MEDKEKLVRILNWCNAYPEDVFEPVSSKQWSKFHKVLSENGLCGSAFTGDCMRHVLGGIKAIIESKE